jgi:hypothetical protein
LVENLTLNDLLSYFEDEAKRRAIFSPTRSHSTDSSSSSKSSRRSGSARSTAPTPNCWPLRSFCRKRGARR